MAKTVRCIESVLKTTVEISTCHIVSMKIFQEEPLLSLCLLHITSLCFFIYTWIKVRTTILNPCTNLLCHACSVCVRVYVCERVIELALVLTRYLHWPWDDWDRNLQPRIYSQVSAYTGAFHSEIFHLEGFHYRESACEIFRCFWMVFRVSVWGVV